MRRTKLFLMSALAVLAAVSLVSCDKIEKLKKIPVTTLKFTQDVFYAVEGQDCDIEYQFAPADHTSPIKWTSSNSDVISADENGKLTTKSYGETTLTISADNLSASCKVIVYADLFAHPWEYLDKNTKTYTEKYTKTGEGKCDWDQWVKQGGKWDHDLTLHCTYTNPAPGKYVLIADFGELGKAEYDYEAAAPDKYNFVLKGAEDVIELKLVNDGRELKK